MTEREQSVLILHDRAPISEIAAMAVLCALTVETGCCAHVCHVPTPQAADLIGEARQRGARA